MKSLISLLPSGHSQKVTVLLANSQHLASGSSDRSIIIWDSNFNKHNQLKLHQGQINSLAMSSNQSHLISSSTDTSIIIWKASLGLTVIRNLVQSKRQIESVIQLDNSLLAAASDDFSIKIFNNSNQLIYNLTGHTNNIYALVEIPNRNQMASSSKDRSISI